MRLLYSLREIYVKFEIAIPVLNEEETLSQQITMLVRFIKSLPQQNDIIVSIADNGSTDKTPQIGSKLSEEYACVSYVRVGERGVGRALKAVWDNSTADTVGYMDLDFSTPLSNIPRMIEMFADSSVNVVSASRYLKDSSVTGRSFVRGLSSHGLNILLRLMLNVKFSDAMAGFKFLRRSLYSQLRDNGLNGDGWFFNAEILIRSEWLGTRVDQLAVHWVDSPGSKVKLAATIRYYLQEIAKLRLEKFSSQGKW